MHSSCLTHVGTYDNMMRSQSKPFLKGGVLYVLLIPIYFILSWSMTVESPSTVQFERTLLCYHLYIDHFYFNFSAFYNPFFRLHLFTKVLLQKFKLPPWVIIRKTAVAFVRHTLRMQWNVTCTNKPPINGERDNVTVFLLFMYAFECNLIWKSPSCKVRRIVWNKKKKRIQKVYSSFLFLFLTFYHRHD